MEGVGHGFDAGVAFEGGFVFCGGGDVGEVGEGFDGDAVGWMCVCGCGEVAELAWVGGGYVEDHGWLC